MTDPSPVAWMHGMTRIPGEYYSVPRGLQLAMLMTSASTLCGAHIKYQRSGAPPRTALLSMTFVSPDQGLPDWMEVEWSNLLHMSPASMYLNEKINRMPKVSAAKRRERNLMEYFDCSRHLSETLVFNLMTGKDTPRGLGTVRSYGRRFNPVDELRPLSLTHMAAGFTQVGKALATIPPEAAKRQRFRDIQLFWLKPGDFAKLARQQGPSRLDRFGLVLGLPGPSAKIPPEFRLPPLNHPIIRLLDISVRHNIDGICFRPVKSVADALDAHQEKVLKLMECPAGQELVPDLAWRLASLIHALCHPVGEQNEERDRCVMTLALPLAEWMTLSHISTMGRLIPSDQEGWFEGDELRIMKSLGDQPASTREIQRSLRGVRQSLIAPALERAMQAGLVIRHPDGRYSLPPLPTIDLSEIR